MLVLAAALFMAAAPVPPAPSPAEQALVDKALAYLQGLTEAKGRFVQVDARGEVEQGAVYLHRPGKVRFEYDPPSGLVIASDGRLVSVLNPRLKSFQNYPLNLTPLSLLLARNIRLDRGAAVTGVTSSADGFAITVREGRGRMQGQIALQFSDRPLALIGWMITDARGASTRVRLVGFAPTSGLRADLFDLRDPRAPPTADRSRGY